MPFTICNNNVCTPVLLPANLTLQWADCKSICFTGDQIQFLTVSTSLWIHETLNSRLVKHLSIANYANILQNTENKFRYLFVIAQQSIVWKTKRSDELSRTTLTFSSSPVCTGSDKKPMMNLETELPDDSKESVSIKSGDTHHFIPINIDE